MTFFFSFFFLSDGRRDVNSNCVSEEQLEAEAEISQGDCHPKASVEGEKERSRSGAGLDGLQGAPAGLQESEE